MVMRTLFERSALAVALVAVTATLAAQAPAGQPPAGQAPAEDIQQPTFRRFIDLVTTDVIVRDGSGQFVADLTK